MISAIDYHAMRDAKVDELTFTVGYSCGRKSYEDVSVVGVSMDANIVQSRAEVTYNFFCKLTAEYIQITEHGPMPSVLFETTKNQISAEGGMEPCPIPSYQLTRSL